MVPPDLSNSTREQFLTLRWALVDTGRVQAVRLAARAGGEWWDAPVTLEGVVVATAVPGDTYLDPQLGACSCGHRARD